MKWRLASGSLKSSSKRVSAKPEMEVSGVFSSWDTLATNSWRWYSLFCRLEAMLLKAMARSLVSSL